MLPSLPLDFLERPPSTYCLTDENRRAVGNVEYFARKQSKACTEGGGYTPVTTARSEDSKAPAS